MNKKIRNVDYELEEIFFKRLKIELKKENGWKDENIFGSMIHLPVNEAVLLYIDITKKFCICLPEERIISGEFDTYNHIKNIICECLE